MSVLIYTNKKAFSLLEVLVSVALFGMLITGLLFSLTTLLKVSFKNNLRTQINEELDLTLSIMQKDFVAADYVFPCGDNINIIDVFGTNCIRFIKNNRQYMWLWDGVSNRLIKRTWEGVPTSTNSLNYEEKNVTSTNVRIIPANEAFKLYVYRTVKPDGSVIERNVSLIVSFRAESELREPDTYDPLISNIFRQSILGTKNMDYL